MDRGAWWAVKIHFIYEDVENSVLHIFLDSLPIQFHEMDAGVVFP